jgi:phosphatidylglycerol:prolipoprotein diacylglycerol transferase
MKKYLFSIGNIRIPGYGFMIGMGFLIALLIGEYRAKRKGLDKECVLDMAIIAILCGFIGAKLLFVIVNFKDFLEAPLSFLGNSGFVVYGGIIAGVLCCILYCYIKKISFRSYFDLIMPEVAIAQGFGRIGCFLAGCCYGRATDSFIGVTFPEGSFAPSGISLIPTQLISALGDFAIAAVLILMSDRITAKIKKPGAVGYLYLCLYGTGRFIIEFFRNDYRGSVGILSTSQFISLFIVLAGALLMVLAHSKKYQKF